MSRVRLVPRGVCAAPDGEPFATPEEAWWWAVLAHRARHDGARIAAGRGLVARPCEPLDVLLAARRLWRHGRLDARQLRVLVAYGERQAAPDAAPQSTQRGDAALWRSAMAVLAPLLRAKGIVA